MSLWSKIKAGVVAFLAAALSVMAVLFYREKAKREEDRRKASEGARKTEQVATDAMTGGQRQEAKEANDALADYDRRRRRDHFE